jgi:hypothetical protein
MHAQCVLLATTLLHSGAKFHSFLYTGSKTVRVKMESCYGGIISYHIYSPSIDLYRYGMRHTVYISMQGICHNTIICNTTVHFVIDT